MEFSRNTSARKRGISLGLLIKATLILIIIIGTIFILGKIDFPSPNKKIEKIISNEKLKIVK
tara:strand:- start:119 stop:304 length:186 start_codon:yes stop_codon:yes gene_type:complete